MNPLEAAAVAFGIVSVFLSVRQNIWSWPTAIVTVVLYFLLFRSAKLYADMGLQTVYLVLSVYGWYGWLRGGVDGTPLRVTRLTSRAAVVLLVGVVTAASLLGALLSRTTDAALPWLDSLTTSTSLAAQWLLTRKILENWTVWMAVDVVYVGMFMYKTLYLTAALYAGFFALAAMGQVQWKRDHDAAARSAQPPSAA